jgi:hypothetical protein
MLKLSDVAPKSLNLTTAVLDVSSNEINVRHVPTLIPALLKLLGELFTALAFVDANDMAFPDIEMGQWSKAEARWTHTKFELRSVQQLLFIFHDPSLPELQLTLYPANLPQAPLLQLAKEDRGKLATIAYGFEDEPEFGLQRLLMRRSRWNAAALRFCHDPTLVSAGSWVSDVGVSTS